MLFMYVRFIFVWLVNTVVILLANNLYPSSYVLGNALMSPLIALILTAFFLTLFLKVVRGLPKKPDGRIMRFGYYFLANSIGIWILARLSVITGFGIPAFYWAFYLGFLTTLAQWVTRQLFKKFKVA